MKALIKITEEKVLTFIESYIVNRYFEIVVLCVKSQYLPQNEKLTLERNLAEDRINKLRRENSELRVRICVSVHFIWPQSELQ